MPKTTDEIKTSDDQFYRVKCAKGHVTKYLPKPGKGPGKNIFCVQPVGEEQKRCGSRAHIVEEPAVNTAPEQPKVEPKNAQPESKPETKPTRPDYDMDFHAGKVREEFNAPLRAIGKVAEKAGLKPTYSRNMIRYKNSNGTNVLELETLRKGMIIHLNTSKKAPKEFTKLPEDNHRAPEYKYKALSVPYDPEVLTVYIKLATA